MDEYREKVLKAILDYEKQFSPVASTKSQMQSRNCLK